MFRLISSCCGVAFVCIACSSCSVTYGNKEVASGERIDRLKVGKSTTKDVYEELGQPSDAVRTEGSGTHWVYRYREAKSDILGYIPFGVGLIAGGKNGDVFIGDFYFDMSDRLVNVAGKKQKLYTSNLASAGRSISGLMKKDDSQKRVKAEMDRLGKKFDKNKGYENALLEEALR